MTLSRAALYRLFQWNVLAVALLAVLLAVGTNEPPAAAVSSIGVRPAARARAPRAPAIPDKTKLGKLPAVLPSTFTVPGDLRRPLETNAWWSGGILEDWPAPLYAWPMVTNLDANGALVSAPVPNVLEKAVTARVKDPLRVFVPDVALRRAVLESSGDWDVTFSVLAEGDTPAFSLTTAQGSPFVQFKTLLPLRVALPGGSRVEPLSCGSSCKTALSVVTAETTYVLASDGELSTAGAEVRLSPPAGGATLSVGAVADGSKPADYVRYALSSLKDTRADFAVTDAGVQTTFRYRASTLFGVFPHQKPHLSGRLPRALGTYETVRGTVTLYAGSGFTMSLPRPPVLPSLPLTQSLKDDQGFRDRLAAEVRDDKPSSGDVYWAAKDLLRKAQLAELADQTGDAALRADAVKILRRDLVDWCTESGASDRYYFSYDTRAGGIIAVPPGFGSEHYNDHHFHVGYFLHSASILARLDGTFAAEYGECMRLLIRDVASNDRRDPSFPHLRHFDPYAGHSWANGLTRFGDGSNQESTSEAVQAWFALAQWGKVTGDKSLEDLGTWLLAQEANAARTYWFNVRSSLKALPQSFTHPMISILWGGKVDYATFFDGSDGAIRGIQFFPVGTPLLATVDDDVIRRIVRPATGGEPTIWTSNLTLVGALAGDRSAVGADDPIDPGYSRSYVEAWQRSLSELGAFESSLRASPCAAGAFRGGGKTTVVLYRYKNDAEDCRLKDIETGGTLLLEDLQPGWNIRTF